MVTRHPHTPVPVVTTSTKIHLDSTYLDCPLVPSLLVVSFGNLCRIIWETKERIEKLGSKVSNKLGKSLINSYLSKRCWSCGTKFALSTKVQIMCVHDTPWQTHALLKFVILAEPATKKQTTFTACLIFTSLATGSSGLSSSPGQDSLLSQSPSPARCINGYPNFMLGVTPAISQHPIQGEWKYPQSVRAANTGIYPSA